MTTTMLAAITATAWVGTLRLAYGAGVRKGLVLARDSLDRAHEALDRLVRIMMGKA